MKKTIYLLSLTMLSFTVCKADGKQVNTNADEYSKEMYNNNYASASTVESELASEIIEAYIQLKNALVKSDHKKAAAAGKVLLTAFSSFNISGLTHAQHKEYMTIAKNAKEQTEYIVKSPIDQQRKHFKVLSNSINSLIALVGTSKTLYQDYCPMYNNNKGGMWLSETKTITNPYFGDKMLSCGIVRKQIN